MSPPSTSAWRSLADAFVNAPLTKRFARQNPVLWRHFVTRCDSSATGLSLTLGVLVALVFLALFLGIAEDVVMHDPLIVLDEKVAALAYRFRNPTLNAVMLAFTDLGAWQTVLAGMVLAAIWMVLRGRAILGIGLCVSVLMGEALVWILKEQLQRPRPSVDHALVTARGASFPSGHAFVAFAFFGYIAWLGFRHATGAMRAVVRTSFIIIATAVGLSRIYLGVHWPSDVLASYLLGGAWLATLFFVIPLIEQTGFGPRLARSDRHPGTALAIGMVLVWSAVFFARYLSDLRGYTTAT